MIQGGGLVSSLQTIITDVVDKPGLRVEVAIAGFVHAVEVVIVKWPLLGPLWGLQDFLRRHLPASPKISYQVL